MHLRVHRAGQLNSHIILLVQSYTGDLLRQQACYTTKVQISSCFFPRGQFYYHPGQIFTTFLAKVKVHK